MPITPLNFPIVPFHCMLIFNYCSRYLTYLAVFYLHFRVLSLLSYTAQIILYVIRIITLFLDRKVSLDAVCYCASLMSYATESVIYTTHQLVTSPTTDTKNSPTRTTDMLAMNTGAIVEAENTEQIIPCQESSYWCLCDVPFGIYPLGVSTGDPSTIDAAFLSNFLSWDYDGDVATHTVNSTEDVIDKADTNFKDEMIVIHFIIFNKI